VRKASAGTETVMISLIIKILCAKTSHLLIIFIRFLGHINLNLTTILSFSATLSLTHTPI